VCKGWHALAETADRLLAGVVGTNAGEVTARPVSASAPG